MYGQNSSPISQRFIPSLITSSKPHHAATRLQSPSEETRGVVPESIIPELHILTPEQVKKTLEQVKSNQEYQKVLKQALKLLDSAMAKNHYLQVCFSDLVA